MPQCGIGNTPKPWVKEINVRLDIVENFDDIQFRTDICGECMEPKAKHALSCAARE